MRCFSDFCRKGVALALSIIFLISGQSAPVHAASPASVQNAHTLSVEDLPKISIPKNQGEISEFHQGTAHSGVVILIQDAHAIPDAQKNIHALIRYFEKNQGVANVAVEGAASPLDAQIFRSFPDSKLLKKVFSEYYDRAELSGAAASSVFTNQATRFQGIEDWNLYEEAVMQYRQAMQEAPKILEQLNAERLTLNIEKHKFYSEELWKVDQAWEAFEENRTQILETLSVLVAIKKPDEGSQIDLIVQSELNNKSDGKDSYSIEIKKVWDKLHQKLSQNEKENRVQIRELNRKKQAYQTGEMSDQAFATWLQKLASSYGLSVKFSNELRNLTRFQMRLEAIRGTKLLKEFESYFQSVKQKLIAGSGSAPGSVLAEQGQTSMVLELDQRTEELHLLRKLANLELSHEDWTQLKLMGTDPDTGLGSGPVPIDLGKYAAHIRFYKNSEKRENAFMQNLEKILSASRVSPVARLLSRASGPRPLILVAGGFHTGGMTEKLKQAGMSYLLVTPKISHLPEKNLYRDHMAGNVSWKSYFKIENGKIKPYDAFVRATRDKLLSRATNHGPRTTKNDNVEHGTRDVNRVLLKAWRDQIIRDLADQGRAQDAWKYTKYLDEILEANHESQATSHSEGMAERLSRRVDQFIQGLRVLGNSGKIDSGNISNLLHSMNVVGWAEGPAAFSGHSVSSGLSLARPSEARKPRKDEMMQVQSDEIAVTPTSLFRKVMMQKLWDTSKGPMWQKIEMPDPKESGNSEIVFNGMQYELRFSGRQRVWAFKDTAQNRRSFYAEYHRQLGLVAPRRSEMRTEITGVDLARVFEKMTEKRIPIIGISGRNYELQTKIANAPGAATKFVRVTYFYEGKDVGTSDMGFDPAQKNDGEIQSMGTFIHDEKHRDDRLKTKLNEYLHQNLPHGTKFVSSIENHLTLYKIHGALAQKIKAETLFNQMRGLQEKYRKIAGDRGLSSKDFLDEDQSVIEQQIKKAYDNNFYLTSQELGELPPVGDLGKKLGPYQQIVPRLAKEGIVNIGHIIYIGIENPLAEARSEMRKASGKAPGMFRSKGEKTNMRVIWPGETVIYDPKRKKIDLALVRPYDNDGVRELKIKNEIARFHHIASVLFQQQADEKGFQTEAKTLMDRVEKQIRRSQGRYRAEFVLRKASEAIIAKKMFPRLFKSRRTEFLQLLKDALITKIENNESYIYLSGTDEENQRRIKSELYELEKNRVMIRFFQMMLELPFGLRTKDKMLQDEQKKVASGRRDMFRNWLPEVEKLLNQNKSGEKIIDSLIENQAQRVLDNLNARIVKKETALAEFRLQGGEIQKEIKEQEADILFTKQFRDKVIEQRSYLESLKDNLDNYDYVFDESATNDEKAEKIRVAEDIHGRVLRLLNSESVPAGFDEFMKKEIQKGRTLAYASAKFFYSRVGFKAPVIDDLDPSFVDFMMNYYHQARHSALNREQRFSEKPIVVFSTSDIVNEIQYEHLENEMSGHGRIVAIVIPRSQKKDEAELRYRHWVSFAKQSGIIPILNFDLPTALEKSIRPGEMTWVDGLAGEVIHQPNEKLREEWKRRMESYRFMNRYFDEHAPNSAVFNGKEILFAYDTAQIEQFIAETGALSTAEAKGGTGVALFRLEKLFSKDGYDGLEGDEERLKNTLLEFVSSDHFNKNPASVFIIRLFDLQDDKRPKFLLEGRTDERVEEIVQNHGNVRFYLGEPADPELREFRSFGKRQIRAIMGASLRQPHPGMVKILLPNVLSLDEISKIEKLILEAQKEFYENNLDLTAADKKIVEAIPVGYMVEDTQAVQRIGAISDDVKTWEAASRRKRFLAIGTNDLLKSVLRDYPGTGQRDQMHPQMIRDLYKTVQSANQKDLAITVEGEWASKPQMLLTMLYGMAELKLNFRLVPIPEQTPYLKMLTRTLQPKDFSKQIKYSANKKMSFKQAMQAVQTGEISSADLEGVFTGLVKTLEKRIEDSSEFKTFVERESSKAVALRSEMRETRVAESVKRKALKMALYYLLFGIGFLYFNKTFYLPWSKEYLDGFPILQMGLIGILGALIGIPLSAKAEALLSKSSFSFKKVAYRFLVSVPFILGFGPIIHGFLIYGWLFNFWPDWGIGTPISQALVNQLILSPLLLDPMGHILGRIFIGKVSYRQAIQDVQQDATRYSILAFIVWFPTILISMIFREDILLMFLIQGTGGFIWGALHLLAITARILPSFENLRALWPLRMLQKLYDKPPFWNFVITATALLYLSAIGRMVFLFSQNAGITAGIILAGGAIIFRTWHANKNFHRVEKIMTKSPRSDARSEMGENLTQDLRYLLGALISSNQRYQVRKRNYLDIKRIASGDYSHVFAFKYKYPNLVFKIMKSAARKEMDGGHFSVQQEFLDKEYSRLSKGGLAGETNVDGVTLRKIHTTDNELVLAPYRFENIDGQWVSIQQKALQLKWPFNVFSGAQEVERKLAAVGLESNDVKNNNVGRITGQPVLLDFGSLISLRTRSEMRELPEELQTYEFDEGGYEQLQLGDLLGASNHSAVHEINGAESGAFVKLVKDSQWNNYLVHEAVALSGFRGIQGVPQLQRIGSDSKGRFYLVLRSVPNAVSLNDYRQSRMFEIPMSKRFQLIRNIVKVLTQVHDFGWAHNDLKPEQIIFNPSSLDAAIIDWELYSHRNETGPEPEVDRRYISSVQPKNTDTDFYSVAVILEGLLLGTFERDPEVRAFLNRLKAVAENRAADNPVTEKEILEKLELFQEEAFAIDQGKLMNPAEPPTYLRSETRGSNRLTTSSKHDDLPILSAVEGSKKLMPNRRAEMRSEELNGAAIVVHDFLKLVETRNVDARLIERLKQAVSAPDFIQNFDQKIRERKVNEEIKLEIHIDVNGLSPADEKIIQKLFLELNHRIHIGQSLPQIFIKIIFDEGKRTGSELASDVSKHASFVRIVNGGQRYQAQPGPIQDVVFFTHNRPQFTEEGLSQFLNNLQHFGHQDIRVHIFDDSNDGDWKTRRDKIRQFAQEQKENKIELIYFGPEERESELKRQERQLRTQGFDQLVPNLQMALGPHGVGANRNWALLTLGTRSLVMVDDDMSPSVEFESAGEKFSQDVDFLGALNREMQDTKYDLFLYRYTGWEDGDNFQSWVRNDGKKYYASPSGSGGLYFPWAEETNITPAGILALRGRKNANSFQNLPLPATAKRYLRHEDSIIGFLSEMTSARDSSVIKSPVAYALAGAMQHNRDIAGRPATSPVEGVLLEKIGALLFMHILGEFVSQAAQADHAVGFNTAKALTIAGENLAEATASQQLFEHWLMDRKYKYRAFESFLVELAQVVRHFNRKSTLVQSHDPEIQAIERELQKLASVENEEETQIIQSLMRKVYEILRPELNIYAQTLIVWPQLAQMQNTVSVDSLGLVSPKPSAPTRSEMRVFESFAQVPDELQIELKSQAVNSAPKNQNFQLKINRLAPGGMDFKITVQHQGAGAHEFILRFDPANKLAQILPSSASGAEPYLGLGESDTILHWVFWEISELGYRFQNTGTNNIHLLQAYMKYLDPLKQPSALIQQSGAVNPQPKDWDVKLRRFGIYGKNFVGPVKIDHKDGAVWVELTRKGNSEGHYTVDAVSEGDSSFQGRNLFIQDGWVTNSEDETVGHIDEVKWSSQITGEPRGMGATEAVFGRNVAPHMTLVSNLKPFNESDETYQAWAQAQKIIFEEKMKLIRNRSNATSTLAEKQHAYVLTIDEAISAMNVEVERIYPEVKDKIAWVREGSYARGELAAGSDYDGRVIGRATDLNQLGPALAFIRVSTGIILNQEDEAWKQMEIEKVSAQEELPNEKLTGVLDMQLVAGSPAVYDALVKARDERFRPNISGSNTDEIQKAQRRGLRGLFNFWQRNREIHGFHEGLFEREPDLKWGSGGLRDMEFSRWAMMMMHGSVRKARQAGLVKGREWDKATVAHQFLMRTREVLHRLKLQKGFAMDKNNRDVLSFELQESIARELGYQEKSGKPSVTEQFLSDYRKHTRALFFFNNKVFRRALHATGSITDYQQLKFPVYLNGEELLGVETVSRKGETVRLDSGLQTLDERGEPALTIYPDAVLNPAQIIKIFQFAAENHLDITGELMDAIEAVLPQFRELMTQNESLRNSVSESVRHILASPGKIGYILFRLQALEILPIVWPGYEGLQNRLIHDFQQRHTLDAAAVLSIEFLDQHLVQSQSGDGPIADNLMSGIRSKNLIRPLRAALLAQSLADANPWRAGELLENLKLPENEFKLAVWLVTNRNLLIDLMRRRGTEFVSDFIEFRDQDLSGDYEKWLLLLAMTQTRVHFFTPSRHAIYDQWLLPLLSISQDHFFENTRLSEALGSQSLPPFVPEAVSEGNGFKVSLRSEKSEEGLLEFEIAMDAKWDQPGTLNRLGALFASRGLAIQTMPNVYAQDGFLVDRFFVKKVEAKQTSGSLTDLVLSIQKDVEVLFASDHPKQPQDLFKDSYSFKRPRSLFNLTTRVKMLERGDSTYVDFATPDRLGILHLVGRVFEMHGLNMGPHSTLDTLGWDPKVGMLAKDMFQVQVRDAVSGQYRALNADEKKSLEEDLINLFEREEITEESFQNLPSEIAKNAEKAARQKAIFAAYKLRPDWLVENGRQALNLNIPIQIWDETLPQLLRASGAALPEAQFSTQQTVEKLMQTNLFTDEEKAMIQKAATFFIKTQGPGGTLIPYFWAAKDRGVITHEFLFRALSQGGALSENWQAEAYEMLLPADARRRIQKNPKLGDDLRDKLLAPYYRTLYYEHTTTMVRAAQKLADHLWQQNTGLSGSQKSVGQVVIEPIESEGRTIHRFDLGPGESIKTADQAVHVFADFARWIQSIPDKDRSRASDSLVVSHRLQAQSLAAIQSMTPAVKKRLRDEFQRFTQTDAPIAELINLSSELGFLNLLFPPFAMAEKIYDSPQFHEYSVAAHTRFVLRALEEAAGYDDLFYKNFQEAYSRLRYRPADLSAFRFGVLGHDLGKGAVALPYEPSHQMHAAQKIIPAMLKDFGLEPVILQEIQFIAWYHQHLNEVARMILKKDPAVTHEQAVLYWMDHPALSHKSPEETLLFWDLLYLMSFGDYLGLRHGNIEAPKVRVLLGEVDKIFTDVRKYFLASSAQKIKIRREISKKFETDQRIFRARVAEKLKSESLEGAAVLISASERSRWIKDFLKIYRTDYLRRIPDEQVIENFKFYAKLRAPDPGDDEMQFLFQGFERADNKFLEMVTGVSFDRPGIFSAMMTGLINVFVQEMDIYTSEGKGPIIDRTRFTVPSGKMTNQDRFKKALTADIRALVFGEMIAEDLYKERGVTEFPVMADTGAKAFRSRISFKTLPKKPDQTVLKIETESRMGLPHIVGRVLFEGFGLNIHEGSIRTYLTGTHILLELSGPDGKALAPAIQEKILQILTPLLSKPAIQVSELQSAITAAKAVRSEMRESFLAEIAKLEQSRGLFGEFNMPFPDIKAQQIRNPLKEWGNAKMILTQSTPLDSWNKTGGQFTWNVFERDMSSQRPIIEVVAEKSFEAGSKTRLILRSLNSAPPESVLRNSEFQTALKTHIVSFSKALFENVEFEVVNQMVYDKSGHDFMDSIGYPIGLASSDIQKSVDALANRHEIEFALRDKNWDRAISFQEFDDWVRPVSRKLGSKAARSWYDALVKSQVIHSSRSEMRESQTTDERLSTNVKGSRQSLVVRLRSGSMLLEALIQFDLSTNNETARNVAKDIQSIGLEEFIRLLENMRDEMVKDLDRREQESTRQFVDLAKAVLRKNAVQQISIGLDVPDMIFVLSETLGRIALGDGVQFVLPKTMKYFQFSGLMFKRVSTLKNHRTILPVLESDEGEQASLVNENIIGLISKVDGLKEMSPLGRKRMDALARLVVAALLAQRIKNKADLSQAQKQNALFSDLNYFGNLSEAVRFDEKGRVLVDLDLMLKLAQEFMMREQTQKSA